MEINAGTCRSTINFNDPHCNLQWVSLFLSIGLHPFNVLHQHLLLTTGHHKAPLTSNECQWRQWIILDNNGNHRSSGMSYNTNIYHWYPLHTDVLHVATIELHHYWMAQSHIVWQWVPVAFVDDYSTPVTTTEHASDYCCWTMVNIGIPWKINEIILDIWSFPMISIAFLWKLHWGSMDFTVISLNDNNVWWESVDNTVLVYTITRSNISSRTLLANQVPSDLSFLPQLPCILILGHIL